MERTKTAIVIVVKGTEEPLCITHEAEFSYLVPFTVFSPIFECQSVEQAIELVHFPVSPYDSSEERPCTDRVSKLLPDGVKISTMRIKKEFKCIKYEPPVVLSPGLIDTVPCPMEIAKQVCPKGFSMTDTVCAVYVNSEKLGMTERRLRKLIGSVVHIGKPSPKRVIYGVCKTKNAAFPEFAQFNSKSSDYVLICSEAMR